MSYSEGEVSSNIDESELCDKIQNLMTNIKTICLPCDTLSQTNKDISRMDDMTHQNNCCTPNPSSKLSTNFSETSSFNCDVSISSLSDDDDKDDTTILLKSNDFIKTSETNLDLTVNDSTSRCNLIPQRTLNKLLALENLIASIQNSLKNEHILSFQILQHEFEDVKRKIKIGTKRDLPEAEVIDIMNRLRVLFEKLILFQSENVTGKKVAGEKVAIENVVSENVASENVASENVASEKVGSENVANENVVSENVTYENVADEIVASKNDEVVQNDSSNDSSYKPKIKPRLNRLKAPKIVTKNTSSLDDLPKVIERTDPPNVIKRKVEIDPNVTEYLPYLTDYQINAFEYQTNVTSYDNDEELKETILNVSSSPSNSNNISNFPYEIKKKSLLLSSLDISRSDLNIYDNNNLHNSSSKPTKSILDRITTNRNNRSRSVSNIPRLIIFRDNNIRNSRLPVLKKGPSINRENNENLSKISYMSEVVTNQVIGNLKRLGLVKKKIDCACESAQQKNFLKTQQINSLTQKNRSRSELALNIPCHARRKSYGSKVLSDKEDNKNFPQSCYLTKIDPNRLKKHCLNDNGLVSNKNARIYNLQTLLKKKKYKIITDKNENEIYQCLMSEVKETTIQKQGETSEEDIDFDKLVSLIGNTFRVIHQLVIYPMKITSFSQPHNLNNSSANNSVSSSPTNSQNGQRDPRLVHIGKVCCCKINLIQTKKDLLRRKHQPPIGFGKSIVLLDIHYDIRKGKPLGCLKLLRQLTGSEMKIFRSSILLPGGYLKEMNSCSVNELVNMSNKHDGIVQTFQQKPSKSKMMPISKSATTTNNSNTTNNYKKSKIKSKPANMTV